MSFTSRFFKVRFHFAHHKVETVLQTMLQNVPWRMGITTVCICKSFIGRLALGGDVCFLLCVMSQTLLNPSLPSVDLPWAHSQDEIRQLYLQFEVFYHLICFLLTIFSKYRHQYNNWICAAKDPRVAWLSLNVQESYKGHKSTDLCRFGADHE